jgi:hypothetical protein
MGKCMGKIRNLPARRADSLESNGKVYGKQNETEAEVQIFMEDVQYVQKMEKI